MLRGGSNWQPLWRFDQWRCRPGFDKRVEMPAEAEVRASMPLFLQSRAMSFGCDRLVWGVGRNGPLAALVAEEPTVG